MIGSFLTTWTHYHRCEGNRVTVQRSIPAFSRLIEANCVFRRQECRPLSNAPALMRFRMMSYMTDHWSTDDNVLVMYNHYLSWYRKLYSKLIVLVEGRNALCRFPFKGNNSRPNALFRSDKMVIMVRIMVVMMTMIITMTMVAMMRCCSWCWHDYHHFQCTLKVTE